MLQNSPRFPYNKTDLKDPFFFDSFHLLRSYIGTNNP